MLIVKNFIEENADGKDTIFIHLHNAQDDENSASLDIVWEGYLKDIPEKYWNREVIQVGQSLKDNENGINGFYLKLKRE